MHLKDISLFLPVFLLLSFLPLAAEDDHSDDKYYHMHEGNPVPHDLSVAKISFEPDLVEDPASQLHGSWVLVDFKSTDHEMATLVESRQLKPSLVVEEDFLQVSVILAMNGNKYDDPPVHYEIKDGVIVLENDDFAIGLKDRYLVLTLVAMDEGYRYTFVRP